MNVHAVAALAAAAREHRCTLVHISSDYVFDGSVEIHDESESFSPLGVYGQTKAAGDALVGLVPAHYVLRSSWVIGDGRTSSGPWRRWPTEGVLPASSMISMAD